MKTPDYLSYDRYKKKKDSNPNRRMLIFITTFFAMLLFFTIIAKALSPNVDVTIGDDSETDAKETGLGVKKFIDERLKMIQMEDNSAGVSLKNDDKKTSGYNDESFNKYSQEADEKVSLPTKNAASDSDEATEEPIQIKHNPPRPTSKDLPLSTSSNNPSLSTKMSKVYVGRYSTIEQAKVAQEILMDAGLDITPFVKDLGGSYTLQIGSYSSKAKADGLASELQRNNFPARVVQE